jgi:hypothetical protein
MKLSLMIGLGAAENGVAVRGVQNHLDVGNTGTIRVDHNARHIPLRKEMAAAQDEHCMNEKALAFCEELHASNLTQII